MSTTIERTLPNDKKFCECGCGYIIDRLDKRGREHRYIWGHGKRGKTFPNQNQRGPQNHQWKGGRFIDKDGYVMIYHQNHPRLRDGRYIYEHILVYEQYHKCCMIPYAVVHHIDHNKQNNDPKNLQGMTRAQHIKLHRRINGS